MKIIISIVLIVLVCGYGLDKGLDSFATSKVNGLLSASNCRTSSIDLNILTGEVHIYEVTCKNALVLKSVIINLNLLESVFSPGIDVESMTFMGASVTSIPKFTSESSDDGRSFDQSIYIEKIKFSDIDFSQNIISENPQVKIQTASVGKLKLKGKSLDIDKIKLEANVNDGVLRLNGGYLNKEIKLDYKIDKLKNLNLMKFLPVDKIESAVLNYSGEGSVEITQDKIKFFSSKGDVILDFKPKDGARYHTDFSYQDVTLESAGDNSLKVKSLEIKKLKEMTSSDEKSISNISIGDLSFVKKTSHTDLKLDLENALISYERKTDTLNLKIDNLDLSPFQQFLRLGETDMITSGKIFANFSGNVLEEQIDGKLEVQLAQLNIDKIKGEEGSLGMLNSIAFLKDKNGVINVESKIKGSLNSPEFSMTSYLVKGLSSLFSERIYSLLAIEAAKRFAPLLLNSIPLNPLSAISAVKSSYDYIVKPRFGTIEFLNHESEFSKRGSATFKKLLKFLKENEKVYLNLCPYSFLEEGESELSKKKVKEVHKKRHAFLKKKLEEFATIEKQVVLCSIDSEFEKKGLGHISINL